MNTHSEKESIATPEPFCEKCGEQLLQCKCNLKLENKSEKNVNDCLNEVAKSLGLDSWKYMEKLFEKGKLNLREFNQIISEAMLLYKEYGKSDAVEFKNWFSNNYYTHHVNGFVYKITQPNKPNKEQSTEELYKVFKEEKSKQK